MEMLWFYEEKAQRTRIDCVSKANHNLIMKDPEFKNEFDRAKDYLKSMHVAFIEIKNDLELYLFEVYCAMDLKTVKWNTFRTH